MMVKATRYRKAEKHAMTDNFLASVGKGDEEMIRTTAEKERECERSAKKEKLKNPIRRCGSVVLGEAG